MAFSVNERNDAIKGVAEIQGLAAMAGHFLAANPNLTHATATLVDIRTKVTALIEQIAQDAGD